MPHQSHNSPIILSIHESKRSPKEVAGIIARARRKVGHNDEDILKLVEYKEKQTKAMVMLTVQSVPGLRRKFILAFRADKESLISAS